MVELEQLIRDGHIFFLEKEEPNIGRRRQIDDYKKPVVLEIFPGYGHSIPVKEDNKLYNLLRKLATDYKTPIKVNDLKKKMKKEFNIEESLNRMFSTIIIKTENGAEFRTSLISGYSFYKNESGEEELTVSIYRGE